MYLPDRNWEEASAFECTLRYYPEVGKQLSIKAESLGKREMVRKNSALLSCRVHTHTLGLHGVSLLTVKVHCNEPAERHTVLR